MCTFASITFIGLLLFVLGESLKVSVISEEFISNYKNFKSKSLLCKNLDNKTALYYVNEIIDSNRLYLPINVLPTKDVLFLYYALARFTHANDDDVVQFDNLPFVVHGYYGVDTNLMVKFMVLITEKKAQLIQNRIRAEFSKDNSIIDQNNYYKISPSIVLDFRYMFYKPSWQYILVTTLQDYSRMQSYGPFIMTSYYCIMAVSMIITIPGSILVCASIYKYKHMQTPPNVYVFSLAVADILLLTLHIYIFVSAVLVNPYTKESSFGGNSETLAPLSWQWQHPPCSDPGYLILSFWKVVCFTSVFTTVDRYIAICNPFMGRRISTYRRAVKVNLSIWALSLITTLIQVIYEKSFTATEDIYFRLYWLILFIVLPICIILPSYVCIAMSLWKSSKIRQSCGTNEQTLTTKSIKIVVVIAVQYIVCWAPVSVYIFLLKVTNPMKHVFVYVCVEYFVCDLFLLGSMFNPVLYALVSKDFRKAFKDLGLLCIAYIQRHVCCGKNATRVYNNNIENDL